MGKFEEVLDAYKARRQRVLDGKYNCLPFPFARARHVYPGFERGKFVLITANQKVGKSKLSDYMFIYEPLFFMMSHPELKVRVLYFSLEMSAAEKYDEFLCYLLSRLDRVHISPKILRSTDRSHPCDPHIFELLESARYRPYIEAYDRMVSFDDTTKNPTGINKVCRNYALEHGHMNYTVVRRKNDVTGKVEEVPVVDPINPYTQDDEDEYRIIILDNGANLVQESGCNSRMETIDRMSKYGISLRKQLKYIFVFIQHQAQAQEGLESIKVDMMRPTVSGLGDCKTTARDANVILGLFNPYKFRKREYNGYSIERLKNYGRFLEFLDDRDYGAGGLIVPLFFDGATSMFSELPRSDDINGLNAVYDYVRRVEQDSLNPGTVFEPA